MFAVAAVAVLPGALAAAAALVASNRAVLLYAALALEFVWPSVNGKLPLPGDIGVWAADLLVVVTLGAWLVARLVAPASERPRIPRAPVLGLPLVLVATSLAVGVLKGSERYGASLLGMPLRIAIYAVIAFALATVQPRQAYRGIVMVLYAGTVWQAVVGVYSLATGTSQTPYAELSTGGTRYLGIAVATYLGAALVLALLNLAFEERPGRRALHYVIAGLALFGVTIAFTRAVFIGLAVVVPLLMLAFPGLRRTLAAAVPVLLAAAAIAVLVTPLVAPGVASTLASRLTTQPAVDSSVQWRERAYKVALRGVDEEPVLGVGFGRESTFYINGMPNVIEGDPHNGFLYLLAGGGAFALASFLVLIGVFLWDAWRRFRVAQGRERALIAWAVSSLFIFSLHAAVEPVLTEPTMILTFWILLLLPATVARETGPRPVVGQAAIPSRQRASPSSRSVGRRDELLVPLR